MPDDRSRRESPDRERIDIHDEHEVRNWAMSLKVTPEQLKARRQQGGHISRPGASVSAREVTTVEVGRAFANPQLRSTLLSWARVSRGFLLIRAERSH